MWLGASEGSFGAGRIFRDVEEGVPAGTAGAPVGHTLVLGLSPLPCGGGSPRTEVAAWAQVYCSDKSSGGFSKNCMNAQIQNRDGSYSSHPKHVASSHTVAQLKATQRDLRAVHLLFQYRCVGEHRRQLQRHPV